MRITSRTGSVRRILGDFENWTPNKTVDFRLLAETFVANASRVRGADKKSQNKKNEYLSSLCRRTFKLKGNKKVRT